MRSPKHECAALLLALVGLAGCATPAWLPGSGADAADGRVARPDAPPEYDVLVAQDLQQQGDTAGAVLAYERAVAKDPDSAFLQRRIAEALVRQNRLPEAIAHAERGFELDPTDDGLRRLLGQLYQLNGAPASAERVLLDEHGDPVDEESGYLLYEIYLNTRRVDDARRTAEWLLARDPDSTRSRMALAAVYRVSGRTEEAEALLRQAIDEDPDNIRAYVALARSRAERGDHAGEMAVFREVLKRNPHHHGALVALSNAQLKLEDLDGAMATLQEVERYHGDDLVSLARLGFLYYEKRRWDDAASCFARVLEQNPEEYEMVFFLGVAQRRAGKPDEAIATFDRIPPESEHYADARTQIAAMYERRERYAEALAEVERANAAEPSHSLELYAATLRSKAGDFEGAVAHLEAMLEETPDDSDLLYNLGVVYGEADRTEQSIAYMRQALEHDPDNANALNYIGYTFAEQNRNLDEAEHMIARAVELRPEDGYIADSMGWVYYMRARPLVEDGRHREARKLLERALEELERADTLTGGDPVVSEHIGDTYLLLDEKQRALDHFEEAVRLEPRYREQPELLEKLESLRRELR